MPLPPILIEAAKTVAFWKGFFWLDTSRPWEGCTAKLMVDDTRGFALDLDGGHHTFHLSLIHLSLAQPTAVGWDDHHHFFPVVFRWPELINLSKRIARCAGLPDSDLIILLLCRFCPITKEDDYPNIERLLERLWASVGIASPEDVAECFSWLDSREEGWTWRNDPALGYVIIDDEVYSCRHGSNPDFPFAAFNHTVTQ